MTDDRVRGAARAGGLVEGLRALEATEPCRSGVLELGPRGHAIATREHDRTAGRVRLRGTITRRRPSIASVPLVGGALAASRHPVEQAAHPGGTDEWTAGLAWLRLGLSERLRDRVLIHVCGRRVGDRRLVDVSMVRGDLAEIAIELAGIEAVLPVAPPAHLHRRLTLLDRRQLRLLGAEGFLTDGPGCDVDVSELLASTYVTVTTPR